jgi:hypothetical protein
MKAREIDDFCKKRGGRPSTLLRVTNIRILDDASLNLRVHFGMTRDENCKIKENREIL